MNKLIANTYNFSTVKGISSKQLDEHYKLYSGYISKVNEIDALSKNAEDYKGSNITYSALRSIKLGETFALNGVKLHELYFENITNATCCPHGNLIKLVDAQWDGFENFMNYLKATCLSARGWAIVCFDSLTGALRIIGSDAHDTGALWCGFPVLVIDVYEHAYFLDFGTNRAAYVDAIFKSINWEIVNDRIEKCYFCEKSKE